MRVRTLLSHTSAQLLILIILGVVHGRMEKHRLPMFNDTPTNLTYYRGDRAILQCSVKNLGTKQIIWKRTDMEHALTVGKFVFVDDPDIDIDNLPHRDEWNLIIRNVQTRHQGIYECQISTKEDLRRYVQLNVIDSPVPRKEGIVITGKDFVEKGDRIVLTCNATGEFFPPEDIDWFKDGSKVKQNAYRGISISKFRLSETKTLHSKLEIDHSDMSDSGNYICRSSDISITSKPVMVLNAETNPNKRDNPDSGSDSSNTGSSGTRPALTSGGKLICLIASLLTLQYLVDTH